VSFDTLKGLRLRSSPTSLNCTAGPREATCLQSQPGTPTNRAARGIYRAGGPTLRLGGMYAIQAAYHSIALVDTDHRATLDAVTGYALRAHMLATGGARANPIVKLTRDAISSWRALAGLESHNDANSTSVDGACQLITVPARLAASKTSA
jgi:hypothetical protein